MVEFFKLQLDYIYFVYGFSFFLLASVCFSIAADKRQRLQWMWLGIFGVLHGVSEWLDLVAVSFFDTPVFELVRLFVLAISFVALIEFIRKNASQAFGKPLGLWVYLPCLILLSLFNYADSLSMGNGVRFFLGFPAISLTAYTIWRSSRKEEVTMVRFCLTILSLATLFYAFLSGLVVSKTPDFPATFLNKESFLHIYHLPVQLIRCLCALTMAFSLWMSLWFPGVSTERNKNRGVFIAFGWAAVCVVGVFFLGWFLVNSLSMYARSKIMAEGKEQTRLLAANVEKALRDAHNAVKLLSTSPNIILFAENPTQENLVNANAVLDRYAQTLDMSVTYLMDLHGMTVASSNRNADDSFVGQSFEFRPYFINAKSSRIGTYFATGVVSGRRAYYAATSVNDKDGKTKIIAVAKKGLDEVEAGFGKKMITFLVDPNGIIFLTSRKDLLYKSLFPLPKKIQENIIASRQFDSNGFIPIFAGDDSFNRELTFEGDQLYAFRHSLASDGWSVVLLLPNQKVHEYRFFAMSIVFLIGIIFTIFFLILLQKDRYQQQLFLSLAKLQSVMDAATFVGIVTTDSRGIIQSVNNAIERITGYSASELVDKATPEIFRRKDDLIARAEELEKEYKKAVSGFDVLIENVKTRGFEHKEWVFVRKDGVLVYVDVSVSALRDQGGAIIGYVGMIIDITERKKTEESLRKSQLSLADAQRITHVGSWEFDVVTGKGYCSDESFRIYGLTPDPEGNATIDLFFQYIPPAEREKLLAAMKGDVIPSTYEVEHHVVREDGSVRVVVQKGRTKLNEAGKLVAIIGSTQDITAQKQIEESLRFTQFCVDHAGEAIVWVDEQGGILYANEMMARIFGYTDKEIRLLKVTDLDPNFTLEVWKQHWKNIRERKLLIFETTNRAKNGRSFPVEITENFVDYSGKEYIIVFMRDITERKLAQEKILKARDFYLHLFEDFPAPIWRAGVDSTFNYFNKSWLSFRGRSLEQEFGGGWLEGVHVDDKKYFLAEYETAFQSRKPFEIEYRLGYRDGTYRWVLHIGRPFTGVSGEFLGYIGSCYDISERKRVEEALKLSEERFKVIVESAGEWIWEINAEGKYTYSNHTVKQLLGYSVEEVVGKKYFYDFLAPEEREALKKLMFEGFEEKASMRNLVNINIHKSGSRVIMNTTCVPVIDKQGNLVGYRGVDTDITERIRMEDALRESRTYLDKVLNTIADPVFVKDRQHRWVFLNNAFCEFMGYERSQLIGKSDYDFFPKHEADIFWEKDEIVFNEGKENINEELFTDSKGVVHTIVTKKSLYHGVDGMVHLVGVIRDITEWKNAQEEVAKAQARYTELINNLTVGVYRNTSGPEGRFLEANQAMIMMFEAGSKEEFLSHPVVDHYVYPEKRAAFNDKIMKLGFINNEEIELVTFKGRKFWASISAVMKKDEQGNIFFDGIVEDISERKHTQEELVLAYSRLQQTQRELVQTEKMASLGRFSAGVAHEIRNPLAIILGGAEFLESSLGAVDKNVKTILAQIKDAVMRANVIVKGLLRFARQSELITERVQVTDLIQDTLGLFKYRAPLENITIETDYAAQSAYIDVDKNQIQQVFFNILMNAIEAMPQGGLIQVKTYYLLPPETGVSADKSSIVICFEDNGEGISKEDMQKLFEPFFTTKRDSKGTGLGLSISKSIVESHRGSIVIDSKQNKGTQVMIILPAG